MKNKLLVDKEKTIDFIYSNINKGRENPISKELIKEVIESQNKLTLEKIREGKFETIVWKGMGKFSVNFNKLQKIFKFKNKDE